MTELWRIIISFLWSSMVWAPRWISPEPRLDATKEIVSNEALDIDYPSWFQPDLYRERAIDQRIKLLPAKPSTQNFVLSPRFGAVVPVLQARDQDSLILQQWKLIDVNDYLEQWWLQHPGTRHPSQWPFFLASNLLRLLQLYWTYPLFLSTINFKNLWTLM